MIARISSNNNSRLHFYDEIDWDINSLNIEFRQTAVITRSMNEKIISCLQNNLSSMKNDSRFISCVHWRQWMICAKSMCLKFRVSQLLVDLL